MSDKIRLIKTVIVEYSPDPLFYDERIVIEDIAKQEIFSKSIDAEMEIIGSISKIGYEIIREGKDGPEIIAKGERILKDNRILKALDIFKEKAEKAKNRSEIIKIMNEIEDTYSIPLRAIEVSRWKQKRLYAEEILQTYRDIASLKIYNPGYAHQGAAD